LSSQRWIPGRGTLRRDGLGRSSVAAYLTCWQGPAASLPSLASMRPFHRSKDQRRDATTSLATGRPLSTR
jgi:hypothetical protein